LPVVTIESIGQLTEGGTDVAFQLTRTGGTSQPLTVHYTVGGTATPHSDYTALTGTVVFAVGAATAEIEVTTVADNEFEDAEDVVITLTTAPSGEYLIGESGYASMNIEDAPPQIEQLVVWEETGTQIGEVTLTRSGGDISQAITAWFEVEGTFEIDGETLTAVLAATAEFGANETSLIIPIIADPNNGGFANVQMPGATTVAPRADQSQLLYQYLDYLDDTSHPVFRLRAATLARRIIPDLPSPISYTENVALSLIRAKVQTMPANIFLEEADKTRILDGIADKRQLGIDWRTFPTSLATQAAAGGAGAYAGLITAVPNWPVIEQNVNALAAQLGAEDFQQREDAEQALKTLIGGYLVQGDFTRATLVVGLLLEIAQTTQSPEIHNRALDVVKFAGKAVRYLPEKLQAIQNNIGVP
jgi:hypothetical protein